MLDFGHRGAQLAELGRSQLGVRLGGVPSAAAIACYRVPDSADPSSLSTARPRGQPCGSSAAVLFPAWHSVCKWCILFPVKTDIAGKVRNTRLAPSRPLLPVFEAIINSLQAIEEAESGDGELNIHLIRATDRPQQELAGMDGTEAPIVGFVIEDNGIGFNEENFDSFNTSETTHKAVRGGKGIGRFSWLKAFDQVSIVSIFRDGEKWRRRSFGFEISADGVTNHRVSEVTKADAQRQTVRTRVELRGLKPQFQRCPKRAGTIAQRIIEHCYAYFVNDEAPHMRIIDDDGETLDLNEIYHKTIDRIIATKTFRIREHEFKVVVLRMRPSEDPAHHLHYFADRRQVTKEQLARFVPNLASRLHDENGIAFVCSVHLYGDYLDDTVSPERQEFGFMRGVDAQLDMYEIGTEELREAVLEVVRDALEPFLDPIRIAKEARIREYVDTQAPEFRTVLKHRISVLERVAPDATTDSIDAQLYQAKRELEDEVRRLATGVAGPDDADARNQRFMELITDLTQSDLVRYVVHRRRILEEVGKALSRTDGSYAKEEAIHKLIYPMRVTSENDIADEQQNLWIVDERLVYHRFLASDVEMYKTLEGSSSLQRPDIVLFNHPLAITEGDSVGSVVILEFKRPMRAGYVEEENPLEQVLDYMSEIRERGNVKTFQGRPVTIPSGCPFYANILCDVTPKIQKFCIRGNYRKTPDGLGYYFYHDELRAYIEVISYEKMLSDAKKRNRAFFEKLGIPMR